MEIGGDAEITDEGCGNLVAQARLIRLRAEASDDDALQGYVPYPIDPTGARTRPTGQGEQRLMRHGFEKIRGRNRSEVTTDSSSGPKRRSRNSRIGRRSSMVSPPPSVTRSIS